MRVKMGQHDGFALIRATLEHDGDALMVVFVPVPLLEQAAIQYIEIQDKSMVKKNKIDTTFLHILQQYGSPETSLIMTLGSLL